MTSKAPTDCRVPATPDPTDAKADGQFQAGARHRDGYNADVLTSAMNRATRGWMLTTSEATALADEIKRLRARVHELEEPFPWPR